MKKKDAEKLLELGDKELADVINKWDGFVPKILIIDKDGAHKEVTDNPAFVAFLSAWSSPENCENFLKEIGVKRTRYGERDDQTDGECDIVFKHIKTGKEFRLNSNGYKFDCYVPVARWALKAFLGQKVDNDSYVLGSIKEFLERRVECEFNLVYSTCTNLVHPFEKPCEEHKDMKCNRCGKPAKKICSETSSLGVCGEFLCGRHQYCTRHITK